MANLPPTPAPSTDIAGKPNALSAQLDTIQLPPAAINSARASISSSSTTSANSDSSYRPLSPASPEARSSQKALDKSQPSTSARKRSSAAAEIGANNGEDYALPPPPTRSRKIIQMKPQTAKGKVQEQQPSTPMSNSPTKGATAPPANGNAGATGGKKKQPTASTAAGRKIARKTAHSLIERRRRSKMNEEFGVLKDMIPACSGQDMHKLAILQASIEYMRYLEICVAELKAAHKNCKPSSASDRLENLTTLPPPSVTTTTRTTPNVDGDYEDSEASDDEMSEAPPAQPVAFQDRRYTSSTATQSRPSISPAILPSATQSPLFSRPGTSANQSLSTLPSPAFLAQQQQYPPRLPSLSLASPEIQAQRGQGPLSASSVDISARGNSRELTTEDHEATASALLMLNTDRRAWSGRGMSVKDLLSTQ
ncbi:HLH-domain-containing protein [Rhizodiscina lignyota]|uniref:HLH-domain-containing protein n=1 Tax=Rhizodiscina lignyota TaxID=1504668 RepID=A0A9P4M4X7_9PEZI|nr:HLH-domain-containing protein [Rhizodiscina lignyota]